MEMVMIMITWKYNFYFTVWEIPKLKDSCFS